MNEVARNGVNGQSTAYQPSETSRLQAQRKMNQLRLLHEKQLNDKRRSLNNNMVNQFNYYKREDDTSVSNGSNEPVISENSNLEDDTASSTNISSINKPSPFYKAENNNENVEDDGYEFSNGNLPRVMSPNTLLKSRGYSPRVEKEVESEYRKMVLADPQISFKQSRNKNVNTFNKDNRYSRKQSIRKILGNPLPLPYLNEKTDNAYTKESNYLKLLTNNKLDDKSKRIDNKWRRLISQDKLNVEKRLKELNISEHKTNGAIEHSRHISNENNDKIRKRSDAPRTSSVSVKYDSYTPSFLENNQETNIDYQHILSDNDSIGSVPLSELQKDISINGQKLDLIITMLTNSNSLNVDEKNKTINQPHSTVSWGIIFWTICITILLLCNIYMYLYIYKVIYI